MLEVTHQKGQWKRTLGEKFGVALDQLAGHGCGSELGEGIPLVALVSVDRDLLDLVDGHLRSFSQALDDDLCADTLLDVLLDLLEDFSSQNHDGGCSVSNFGILRAGDVDEDTCGGVNDIEELNHC